LKTTLNYSPPFDHTETTLYDAQSAERLATTDIEHHIGTDGHFHFDGAIFGKDELINDYKGANQYIAKTMAD
jgi:hypothetical protein